MTIAVIGTVGVPACYGGFETLVDNLLDDCDAKIAVFCSSTSYSCRPRAYKCAVLHYVPFKANGVQSIIYDAVCVLCSLVRGYRKFLVLGVSGTFILPFVKFIFPRSFIVTNIDGLEWKREKWGKYARQFLKWSEKIAVLHSDVVVADNQAISDYVFDTYGVAANVIPYGGDHAVANQSASLSSVSEQGYYLSLCRIEPENNVHVILNAFARTTKPLVFIGNWDNSEYGRKLKQEYSELPNIQLRDPEYDLATLFEVRAGCAAYVHGHSAGGTNPSLVEMMHFAKPILAFDCIYNRATMEDKGCYFGDVEALVACIERQDGRHAPEMLEIAQRRYTWSIVQRQYLSLFGEG